MEKKNEARASPSTNIPALKHIPNLFIQNKKKEDICCVDELGVGAYLKTITAFREHLVI